MSEPTRADLYVELRSRLEALNAHVAEVLKFAASHNLRMGQSTYNPSHFSTLPQTEVETSEAEWSESNSSEEWIGSQVCW